METLMHSRLGHPGRTMTTKIAKAITGAPAKWKRKAIDCPCPVCAMAKFQEPKAKGPVVPEAEQPLIQLHVDVCGPINPGAGPFQYFMVIVDRSTKNSWVSL